MAGKRRSALDGSQLGFTFDPPAPARLDADLAGLDRVVSATVAKMLEGQGSRYIVAGRMSALLDTDVSKLMLDAYASESREGHAISAARLLALVAATERFDLFDTLVRRIGCALLVGEEIITAEIGNLDRQIAELKARRRSIEQAAPVIKRSDRA